MSFLSLCAGSYRILGVPRPGRTCGCRLVQRATRVPVVWGWSSMCTVVDVARSRLASPPQTGQCLAVHRLTWLAISLVVACTSPTEPVPKASLNEPEKPAVAPPIATPGVQADGEVVSAVQWFSGSFEAALAAAKAQDKRVFVEVGAYWCPPCRKLDEEVFTQPAVGEALAAGYIALHIDAESGEGPELVTRYRVQAYPTLLVLEASGLELGRLVDAVAADELVQRLGEISQGNNVLGALEAAVKANPDDLEARYQLGSAYALAAQRELAEAELARVVTGDPDNARGLAARALADQAAFLVAKQDGDGERAITLYRELQRRFPTARESLRAYRQIGRELHRLGRSEEAIASLEAMVAAAPDDIDVKASYGWFSFRERCDPASGLRAVEAGLATAPDNAELHYLRAELKHLLQDAPAALASIREAARLEPESAFYKRQVRRFAAEVSQ